ncbi:Carbohydrate esterase 4 protein [Tulasnella sp. UAMH 9824]|nr:Carbohydrate esterase 4 protein [Tulasnella sp. UAMH 9824]
MFTTSRILAASLLAALASALPTTLPKLTKDQALKVIRQETGGSVISACTVPNTVAITFDDGPYLYTNEIVETLAQFNAKATFFVNGNNFECIYSPENEMRLKNAYAAGHQLASHTWSHLDWVTLSDLELLNEMTRTDDALTKIVGVKPAFVRPPFGSYNEDSVRVANANGQTIAIWDFDSLDSDGVTTPDESVALYQNVATEKPVSILTLNHETSEGTARQVLPFALNVLSTQGYQFVTVAECLGGVVPPYQSVAEPQVRDCFSSTSAFTDF